ncbi:MAG: hypothetical protein R6T98_00095 [Desulfatiglandales bacterium]
MELKKSPLSLDQEGLCRGLVLWLSTRGGYIVVLFIKGAGLIKRLLEYSPVMSPLQNMIY